MVVLAALGALILMPDGDSSFWDFNVVEVITLIVGGAILFATIVNWAWHRWRSPIDIWFLIPRARYRFREFAGAGSVEVRKDTLYLHPGTYTLLFKVDVRSEIEVLTAGTAFVGEGSANLEDRGPNNLWIVEREEAAIGGIPRIRDWDGQWKNPVGHTWPANVPHMLSLKVEAVGPFKGRLEWTLAIKGRAKPLIHSLRLIVDDKGKDDIPFLEESALAKPN